MLRMPSPQDETAILMHRIEEVTVWLRSEAQSCQLAAEPRATKIAVKRIKPTVRRPSRRAVVLLR